MLAFVACAQVVTGDWPTEGLGTGEGAGESVIVLEVVVPGSPLVFVPDTWAAAAGVLRTALFPLFFFP